MGISRREVKKAEGVKEIEKKIKRKTEEIGERKEAAIVEVGQAIEQAEKKKMEERKRRDSKKEVGYFGKWLSWMGM